LDDKMVTDHSNGIMFFLRFAKFMPYTQAFIGWNIRRKFTSNIWKLHHLSH